MSNSLKEFAQNCLNDGSIKALRMFASMVLSNAEDGGIIDKDALGENAKRMLKLGITMHRLAELGFTPRDTEHLTKFALFENREFINNHKCYGVAFEHTQARVLKNFTDNKFDYDSETFTHDVIACVEMLTK